MNRNASNQTRKVRKVLADLPVKVSTMRDFPDTAIAAEELEHATTARARLVAAGFNCSDVRSYSSLGFHLYVTP